MRRLFATSLLLLLAAACSQGDKSAPNSGASGSSAKAAEATVAASASAVPPTVAAAARKVSISNNLIDYEYGYPAAAAAIPALKTYLDGDLASRQHELENSARTGRKDAKEGGKP